MLVWICQWIVQGFQSVTHSIHWMSFYVAHSLCVLFYRIISSNIYFNGLVHPCSIKACSYLYVISTQRMYSFRRSCITWHFTYLFMQIHITKCYVCPIICFTGKPLNIAYLDSMSNITFPPGEELRYKTI